MQGLSKIQTYAKIPNVVDTVVVGHGGQQQHGYGGGDNPTENQLDKSYYCYKGAEEKLAEKQLD